MLRIDSVSKRFRSGNYGVRELSLDIRGGVLGLLGPNGAGKTTLMQMIATVTKPSAGKIFFRDEDVVAKPDALRRRLGYLPQDFGVYDNLTALEFLSYFAALKGVRSRAKIQEMLELVNLHQVANRAVGGFSGGMKQRLGIAQALINDPDLVIVDEPTAGLDPEERVRFRNVLSDLGMGRLVILSAHIVSDVESIATEIAIMRDGALVALAPPEELMRRARGSVWEVVVSSEKFDELRRTLHVSSAVRKSTGVQARIVAPYPPVPLATPVEPTLEDAFLFTMRNGAAGVTAAAEAVA
jgi:ABC-2 type transport system ATP-binding protein